MSTVSSLAIMLMIVVAGFIGVISGVSESDTGGGILAILVFGAAIISASSEFVSIIRDAIKNAEHNND